MIKTIKYFTFLSLIALCLILGFWQIDRGNEKSYIYNSYMSGLLEAPEHFNKLPDKPSQFTNVIIEKSIFSVLIISFQKTKYFFKSVFLRNVL